MGNIKLGGQYHSITQKERYTECHRGKFKLATHLCKSPTSGTFIYVYFLLQVFDVFFRRNISLFSRPLWESI
jgi:hypothetical protein